jgi:hypothetical protein
MLLSKEPIWVTVSSIFTLSSCEIVTGIIENYNHIFKKSFQKMLGKVRESIFLSFLRAFNGAIIILHIQDSRISQTYLKREPLFMVHLVGQMFQERLFRKC